MTRPISASQPPNRSAGRPLVRQGRLGLWLVASALDREVVAEKLGISRRYLDHIAREDRRPSLAVAAKIEKLTGGAIPTTYFAAVQRHVRLRATQRCEDRRL
jgi:transcriptional regulator with XRE-family HTH domain